MSKSCCERDCDHGNQNIVMLPLRQDNEKVVMMIGLGTIVGLETVTVKLLVVEEELKSFT